MNAHSRQFALLAAALALPPALFSEEVVEMERYEVTAQQRVQPISEVPLSVTAYSGGTLATLGVSQYKDLAPFVPGVFIQEQSPNNPGINIRGVTTDSGDPRSETRVSLFQDGVSISRSRASVVELFDMERVEVLKGPQGTLFGRGAEIGAISLVQNKAADENASELSLGAGSFESREVKGFVNAKLVPNQLFARAAFVSSKHDGFIDNIADGSTLNGKRTDALKLAFRWLPSDASSLDLILNYQNDNPPGTSFKSGSIAPHGGDTSPFTFAELNRGRDLYIDRTVWGATAIFTNQVSDYCKFTSITGLRRYDSMEEFDADGSYLNLLEFAEDAQGNQVSQELRLNFDTKQRLSGFIGAGYFHEKGRQRVPFHSDERYMWPFLSGRFRSALISAGVPSALANAAIPTMNPLVPQTHLPTGFALFATPGLPSSLQALSGLAGAKLNGVVDEEYINSATTDAVDLFADASYKLTERLELTAGLRLTRENDDSGYQVINAGTSSHIGFIQSAGSNVLFAPTNGLRSATMNQTGWSGRLVANYELARHTHAYASLSRGRRPESLILSATSTTKLQEEVVLNYEVGLKGMLLNRRVQWNAAAFRYEYSHFQTSVADASNLGRYVSTDAGNATGQGLEFALQGALNSHLSLFSSYGFTDATFDTLNDQGLQQLYAGNKFRLTARHATSVGALLRLPCGKFGQLSLTPVLQYKSQHFFEDNNANFNYGLGQGGYSLVNLRAAWTSANRKWEIQAYADNLLDKDYLIDAGNTGGSFGIPTYIAGSPMVFGTSITRRF